MTIQNRRPGVYSQYDVSSFYTAALSQRGAVLIVPAEGGEAASVYTAAAYNKVAELFPGDEMMLGAAQILFRCGVSKLHLIPVRDGGYGEAFEAAKELEDVGAVVSACTGLEDLQALRELVGAASSERREQVAFAGLDGPEDAMAAAKALNSERMVLCSPASLPAGREGTATALYTAAAVAGAVLAQGDAAHNFSGEALRCIGQVSRLPESTVQALLQAGVTVVEPAGQVVRLVRALTTRTTTGGISDRSMTGLNSILIIDELMRGLRARLEALLRGGRVSTQSLDSVAAQVTVELARRQDEGLIESFEAPGVHAHEEDPSVCVVELAFAVAHVVNQIYVTAHIQV